MAGCDGWVTIKVIELLASVFCIIYKRVSDDEANKLFYLLQKYSREWPLLNNITWEENGAIFVDVTFGGFVLITVGLIIAHCNGELHYARKMENYFLIMGTLLFISAGSLILAALDSVEERLVDNAAVLGVVSLLTGMVFLVDLILAGKRRKHAKIVKKLGPEKTTQTEDTKIMEVYRSSDMNGNVHNGQTNGYQSPFLKMDSKKIPKNGVKILPTPPEENYRIPVTNSNKEFVGTIMSPMMPPVYSPGELKTQEAKIKSTESFLRSEKGEVAVRRKEEHVVIPAGYVLVPASQFEGKREGSRGSRGSTPPGYAQVLDKKKPDGFVMVPIEDGKARKLQSPTVTTTMKSPQGYYYQESEDRQTPYPQSPGLSLRASNLSLSEAESDNPPQAFVFNEKTRKVPKYSPEYLQMNQKHRKHSPMSDDSPDMPKYFPTEHYPQYKIPTAPSESRQSNREGDKWSYLPRRKSNQSYADEEDEIDFAPSPFHRNSSYRSSRIGQGEKPKSILRLDQSRVSKRKEEPDLNFPKDIHYNSLDSQKIAEDLKQLKEITKSDLDLTQDLEKENQLLKDILRKEKQEKEKLKKDFKIELENKEEKLEKSLAELVDRKRLEERVSELESLREQLKLEKNIRDVETRHKLEEKIRDLEDEKDRRMSEREVQYFGISDLKQSQKDSSPVTTQSKPIRLEDYFKKEAEGAKETNAKLKEKVLEREDKAKEEEEMRKIIDDGFHFLDEDERNRRMAGLRKPELSSKPKLIDKRSAPDLTNIYQKSVDSARKHKEEAWRESPGGSDESPYSQITDEEVSIRMGTPASASYKSEAQFWMGGDESKAGSTPTTPRDPGFVLHTAHNWPEPSPSHSLARAEPSPASPQDRFQFSSKKAQRFKFDTPSPEPEPSFEDSRKSSPRSQLLDHEEVPDFAERIEGRRRGLLVRKVDFVEEPDTIIRPSTVAGNQSTWKKWLQPKPKAHATKSTP